MRQHELGVEHHLSNPKLIVTRRIAADWPADSPFPARSRGGLSRQNSRVDPGVSFVAAIAQQLV